MPRRHPLPLFLLALSFAACVRSAPAGTVWVESGAAIDTVVADTATVPPAKTLTPPAAPVPFKGFRYPHVDESENVTFITDDPAYTDNGSHHGIYRSYAADGRLQNLIDRDDFVPGTKIKYDFLRGLQVDERGVDFVFNATDGHGARGLFYWTGGTVRPVARRGVTVLPGETAPLSDVHWGAVNAGRVLYVAVDAAGHYVLVLHDLKTGTNRVLLRDGDAIPGHPGETFHYIAHQNWLDGSSIVFRAANGDIDATSKAKEKYHGGVYGWYNVHWDDPATLDKSRLVTLADTDTPMPGLDDAKFQDFRSAPVHDGLVAFEASSDGGGRGIYFSKDGGPARMVVDSETEMAGLFPHTFRSFGIWPAAVENGVVFTATAQNFTGVFLYRTDRDALYLLADNRAPLEGKTIEEFEIGARPMVGNRCAVTVNFTDESAGVYLATIPARVYKHLSAH